MKKETRNNGIKNYTVLIADEGKVLKRKGFKQTLGTEIALGYSYYINGEKVDKPHKDKPSDFEEVELNNE